MEDSCETQTFLRSEPVTWWCEQLFFTTHSHHVPPHHTPKPWEQTDHLPLWVKTHLISLRVKCSIFPTRFFCSVLFNTIAWDPSNYQHKWLTNLKSLFSYAGRPYRYRRCFKSTNWKIVTELPKIHLNTSSSLWFNINMNFWQCLLINRKVNRGLIIKIHTRTLAYPDNLLHQKLHKLASPQLSVPWIVQRKLSFTYTKCSSPYSKATSSYF